MNSDDDAGRNGDKDDDFPVEVPLLDSDGEPKIGISTIMSIDPDAIRRVANDFEVLAERMHEVQATRDAVTARLGNADNNPAELARGLIRARALRDDVSAVRGELLTLRTAAQSAMPLPKSREAFLQMFHRMDESLRFLDADIQQALDILRDRGITEDMARDEPQGQ